MNILLAALAGCRTFFCERAAQESGITLKSVSVTVTGNFDPRGVCGERFDPGFLGLMVRLSSDGPDGAKAQLSLQAFKSSCPVYATLARAAPVELTLA